MTKPPFIDSITIYILNSYIYKEEELSPLEMKLEELEELEELEFPLSPNFPLKG